MTEVSINKQTKLSEHFTLAELTKTNTKILNVPNEAQVENLKRVCEWLEHLREKSSLTPGPSPKGEGSRYKETPIIINSGYRSPQVNKAVGGAPNSNHLTGCAVDIHVSGMEQLIRYAAILLDISDERQEDFDELLLERSPRGSYWLHFAVRPSGNRRKVRLIQT
jgi:hypothetical protein